MARRYPQNDTSLPARYARAISTYRHSDLRAAIAQIDSLIQAQPNNPYFYELKGQALLEGGRPAEAISSLRHAAQIAPQPALIQVLLAQALIATNKREVAHEAENSTPFDGHQRSLRLRDESPEFLRLLEPCRPAWLLRQ